MQIAKLIFIRILKKKHFLPLFYRLHTGNVRESWLYGENRNRTFVCVCT